ncbi:peroxiredoxin family protein [Massilia genomosp. 1]|uniref:Redoxin domain-containing protein n=1 Tax=Massilia genomosp. 1 TaxID=2609280 RepID=A0ABX0MPG7_9BURK|nr:TlpA disulfide reductase family protein [Massilia genomosp. 1]NHZ64658.1 redoxin domain-containing protein [Massilia genomosp. 1]
MTGASAPEFQATAWLNASGPVSLAGLRGKVVALYAFQMLCPSCVSHGIPQAKQIQKTFARDEVEVLGLHTVFEHHAAMGRTALQAFIHEYRIDFPVGIDQPSERGPVPLTMERYQLRGTPTLLLFDRHGVLRHTMLGVVPDMQAGSLIARLVAETLAQPHCDDGPCRI